MRQWSDDHVMTLGAENGDQIQVTSFPEVIWIAFLGAPEPEKVLVLEEFPGEFSLALLQALMGERTFFDFDLQDLSCKGRIVYFPDGDPVYALSMVHEGRGHLIHMKSEEVVQLLNAFLGLVK